MPGPERGPVGDAGWAASPLSGRLLVAAPGTGGIFTRSVVLLLHHDENGAHGLILNKPLEAPVRAVLPDWHDHVTAPPQVFQGGPVGLDTAMGIIGFPGEATGEGDGSDPVGISLLFGSLGVVDLDVPPDLVTAGASGLRVFAGYSGWQAGQLEAEIGAGAWYVVESEPRDPFTADHGGLWRQVLSRQAGALALLSTHTPHPERN